MCNALVTQKQLSSLVVDRISTILGLPDEEAAVAINDRIKAYSAADKLLSEKSFSEFGKMAYAVQERKLWMLMEDKKGKPFGSFDRWARSFDKVSRAKLFEAKKVYEELHNDITDEEMDCISRGNLKTLTLLPNLKRSDPEILEAARNMEPKEFHNVASEKSPDSHLGKKVSWKLFPTDDQMKIYREHLDEYQDAGSDEDKLEYVFADLEEYKSQREILMSRVAELEDALLKVTKPTPPHTPSVIDAYETFGPPTEDYADFEGQ